jgi:hypothetical protein
MATLPRYDVIVVVGGKPQPRQSFNAVDAAAEVVAKKHTAGHIVKVLTNAITAKVNRQRLEAMAERVNKILADQGSKETWQS